MADSRETPKRPRVPPVPEQIDASPEEIAEIVLPVPPRRNCGYIKARGSAKRK